MKNIDVFNHKDWFCFDSYVTQIDSPTRFIITNDNHLLSNENPIPDHETPSPAATILMIDDEQYNHDLMKLMLMKTDYRMASAENGTEALELLKYNK